MNREQTVLMKKIRIISNFPRRNLAPQLPHVNHPLGSLNTLYAATLPFLNDLFFICFETKYKFYNNVKCIPVFRVRIRTYDLPIVRLLYLQATYSQT